MEFKAGDGVTDEVLNDAGTGTGAAAPVKEKKAVTMKTSDAGSDALIAAKATEALAGAMVEAAKEAAANASGTDSKKVNDRRFTIVTHSRKNNNA